MFWGVELWLQTQAGLPLSDGNDPAREINPFVCRALTVGLDKLPLILKKGSTFIYLEFNRF